MEDIGIRLTSKTGEPISEVQRQWLFEEINTLANELGLSVLCHGEWPSFTKMVIGEQQLIDQFKMVDEEIKLSALAIDIAKAEIEMDN